MDYQELKERQSWTLSQKIDHSLGVIEQFYSRLNGNVYVSFSGGKDSTVLLWLARKIYPNIKAVFCNTGNEYPDIVKFVRSFDNIDIIRPELHPKEVIAKHGFPLISKEISSYFESISINPDSIRSRRALGEMKDKYKFDGEIPAKYKSLIGKFRMSDKCCNELKKKPFKKYEANTGLHPIMGVMADESILRTITYIKRGHCNSFEAKRINSQPMSIWIEANIWECAEKYNIPLCCIYPKGAKRTGCMLCGFGCQFKNDNRLELVYHLYPKVYNVFMGYSNNGIEYREALREILKIDGLYLPDERPKTLFD